jgi:hypothetical protein
MRSNAAADPSPPEILMGGTATCQASRSKGQRHEIEEAIVNDEAVRPFASESLQQGLRHLRDAR